MATLSDINNTVLSGLTHIDALLDVGPDWNYLTPAGNTIYYTFSITSGNEEGRTGQEAFTVAQQNWASYALVQELGRITGINFVETADGNAAHIHFCNIDLAGSNTTGLCSWHTNYSYDLRNNLVSYNADAYVYLDNAEWYARNRDLTPGGQGYETLLHELGHALGLKHPFEDDIRLPRGQDNTGNTLMSYDDAGGPYQHLNQYDIAALNWIYGGDGLRGALGINSIAGARYFTGTNAADTLTGTAFDDKLEGAGGNDLINGGDGNDTVVFRGARSQYTFSQLDNGGLLVSGNAVDGIDTLVGVEFLQFSDGSYERAQVAGDTTPPPAPVMRVVKNAQGYATGNSVLVSGSAEAHSTVRVYVNDALVGTVQVDASGIWSLTSTPLKDGRDYMIYADATDAAGNRSAATQTEYFHVDAVAPVIPSAAVNLQPDSNQPHFTGMAEAGTTIQLVRVPDAIEIGHTTVAADGSWKIESAALPNGEYTVSAVSVDKANNATSAAERLTFKIESTLNKVGDGQANTFVLEDGRGNNAIDGKGGLDVVVYSGARAGFAVKKDVYGYAVIDNVGAQGRDTLLDVERIKFADNKWVALDIDGTAGQVYRLYQAAFDRTPDAGGFSFWLDSVDNHGLSLNSVAQLFIGSKEFTAMYMSDPSDQHFLTQLYAHVLHRVPDAGGMEFWLNSLKVSSRAHVLTEFSESMENQAQVIGSIQHGIEYTPYGGG